MAICKPRGSTWTLKVHACTQDICMYTFVHPIFFEYFYFQKESTITFIKPDIKL